ncbi:biliverdin-producing heme oxygenase [Alteromonas sp. A081]|uniref:biliverdin-producing heme oxygenase n=1 Tax=Alteromonas sp. A081 TaxID=3410269 RepID=UPI003B986F12
MQELFMALKQDTLEKHTTLEQTPPFSLFHNLSTFSPSLYDDVLSVMSVFHSTTSSHVSNAISNTPCLAALAEMLNTDEVSAALKRDKQTQEACTLESQNLEDQKINALKSQLTFRGQHSAAIAAMYVWLGSSMGANVISRRLTALNSDIPTEYYSAMAACAKAWIPFKQNVGHILTELKLDDDDGVRDIVEDAKSWFSFLIALGKAQTDQQAQPSQ